MARTTTSNRLADMNLTELIDELRATKHEALNLRFRNATGQLDNPARIREVRHDVARIATVLREREIETERSATGPAGHEEDR